MPEASLGHPRGIWIALSTFVPTFLTVVLGIPYLAGLPMTTRSLVGSRDCAPPVVSSSAPGAAPGRTIRVGGLADAGAQLASTPTREALGNVGISATASLPDDPSRAEDSRTLPSAAAIMRDGAWARGPAFLQKESAAHFAARMQRVGFPTHVTRDDRRGVRWVVWIGNPNTDFLGVAGP
jgi:hypothetical protein